MRAERGSTFALAVNSALAFACAELSMAVLHEAAHGAVAQRLGFAPRIYAFYENNPTGSPAQTLLIAAAGPIVSLVAGAILWIWYRRGTLPYSFWALFVLWSALVGIMTFVNYLIVMPFFGVGDTAQIADVMHWKAPVRYAFALLGVSFVFALARPVRSAFLSSAPASIDLGSSRAQRRYILFGFYLPLVVGTILTAAAGIGTNPINVGYGLLGTFGNIDIVVAALYARCAEPAVARTPAQDVPPRFDPRAAIVYVAVVLVYVLAFSHGVPV